MSYWQWCYWMVGMFLLITLLLLISGCAATTRVNIPVAAPCAKLILPKRSYLPIYDLKPASPPGTVVKAYIASVELLRHDLKLIHDINGG